MNAHNNIKLESSAEWNSERDWSWEVWVKADEPETLAKIQKVQYVLHPTFRNRLVDIVDRTTNFKLKGRGWGEFMIHANLFSKDALIPFLRLSHWIKFRDKTTATEATPEEKPTIFISYSRADSSAAGALRGYIEKRGLEVVSSQDIELGEISSGISNLISKADAIIALIGDEPSQWMMKELDQAKTQQIVTLPVLLGSNAKLPRTLSGVQASQISDPNDYESLLKTVDQGLSSVNLHK